MKISIYRVILIAFLLWPRGAAYAQSESISPSDTQLTAIEQIWNDGTLLLKNGVKIRVPREALKRPEIQSNQEIIVYARNGRRCEDGKGRRVGWLLVMDPVRKNSNPLPVEVPQNPLPDDIADRILTPQTSANFNRVAGYNLVSSATVAPPVGAGLLELEGKLRALNSGGTVFLEDGKQVRLGKNVLRDTMGSKSTPLLFCISRSKKTDNVVRDLMSASAKPA